MRKHKRYIKFCLPGRESRFASGKMPSVGRSAAEPRGAKMCQYGFHACMPMAGGRYIGQMAFVVALSGDLDVSDEKVVGSRIRTIRSLPWSAIDMVDFARACADRAKKYAAHAAAASYAAAASDYAAYAASAERQAQWDWIVARLRTNGADLSDVEGCQ